MKQYDIEKAKQKLLWKIRQDKRKFSRKRYLKIVGYTAIALVLLGLGYLFKTHGLQSDLNGETDIAATVSDSVRLELPDGDVIHISKDSNTSIVDQDGNRIGLQKGGQLVYRNGYTTQKVLHSTLWVPYGKRFQVILSDGTKVYLNAGSSLRYPATFAKGEKRQVFLKGEGYFEVTEDREHPFIVSAENLDIRVLGTRFNVSAYPDDKHIGTALVEGSVTLYEMGKERNDTEELKQLEAGQLAVWDHEKIKVSEVDTKNYTSWMDGRLVFDYLPFEDILKRLERSYNLSIENKYETLNAIRFTASFDTETIEEVLAAFSKNYPLKYTIQGANVSIEKP